MVSQCKEYKVTWLVYLNANFITPCTYHTVKLYIPILLALQVLHCTYLLC